MTPWSRTAFSSATSIRFYKKDRRLGDLRAGNGTRTRDLQFGKLMLYQLSYSREATNLEKVEQS